MLVQVYLIEDMFGVYNFALLREDDYVASFSCGRVPKEGDLIDYQESQNPKLIVLKGDKTIELLDTMPQSEVEDYVRFIATVRGDIC